MGGNKGSRIFLNFSDKDKMSLNIDMYKMHYKNILRLQLILYLNKQVYLSLSVTSTLV
jgi:hypothetical protein